MVCVLTNELMMIVPLCMSSVCNISLTAGLRLVTLDQDQRKFNLLPM